MIWHCRYNCRPCCCQSICCNCYCAMHSESPCRMMYGRSPCLCRFGQFSISHRYRIDVEISKIEKATVTGATVSPGTPDTSTGTMKSTRTGRSTHAVTSTGTGTGTSQSASTSTRTITSTGTRRGTCTIIGAGRSASRS